MGSFIGHAVPGSFFFLFGLWWLTQGLRRYFLCRHTRQRFRSSATFPMTCCPGQRCSRVPMESILKIVACGLGIIVEIIGGINKETHRFDSVGNTQHITMYFFFALSGVIDILTSKKLAPNGSDYLGIVVALLVEGALFKFHLYGRDELDILLHVLLLYTIGISVLVVILEAAYRHTPALPMLRGLLSMLQGSWFWGVAVILYNPDPSAKPWDPESHHSLMLAVIYFTWHVAAHILISFIVGSAIFCYYKRQVHYSKLDTLLPLNGLRHDDDDDFDEEASATTAVKGKHSSSPAVALLNGRNGGVSLRSHEGDDDDSDMEFQAPVRK